MLRYSGPRSPPGVCVLLLLLCANALASVVSRSRQRGSNERPVLGILAQECDFTSFHRYGRSYIAASYVKFLESAGARVVPIRFWIKVTFWLMQAIGRCQKEHFVANGKRLNRSEEEYDKIFQSINGMPSGVTYEALAHLACKYFVIPATTVPCERLFSLSALLILASLSACVQTDGAIFEWKPGAQLTDNTRTVNLLSVKAFILPKVLFPGGGVDLKTSEYSRIARIFYNKALMANDKGDYFPVWGTCLGHEELTYLTSGEILLTWTNTEDFALPLNFTTAAKDSRMFKNFPDDLLQKLATESLTAHFHHWSLSVQNFTQNAKLRNFYKVLTTNTHADVEFISTMEAHKYPIYGVQWHPEKNPFEWKNSSGIPHSTSAMKVAYYVADFLVNEARKSLHHFPNESEETKALIYNYTPVFTGIFSPFEQVYFFD